MTRRWIPVVLVAVGLVAVGFAASGTGLSVGQREPGWETGADGEVPVDTDEPFTLPTEPPLPEDQAEGPSLPPWVSWLVLGILAGIPALLILALVARRLLSWLADLKTTVPEPPAGLNHQRRDAALVEQAVEAGLSEIDLGTDPRSAILACWVHFEHAGEAVGLPREASDTPADLVGKLLEHHELPGASLRRLSEAYLRARYSPHEVTEHDRDEARTALVDLRGRLGVGESR